MTLSRASTRNVALVIVAVLAFAGLALFFVAWMGAIAPAPPFMSTVELRVTDVQFDTGYLTLTVRNVMDRVSVQITEVMVDDLNQAVPPLMFRVDQKIPAGEQRLISVGCEWTSGSVYQIRLTYTRGDLLSSTYYAIAP